MKFSKLFALFMVSATLLGTVPVDAAQRSRSGKRSKQRTNRAPVKAAPVTSDAQYAPARQDRRAKMTTEQIKRVRMQRIIRNILFVLGGAAVLYAADQGFNLREKMGNVLNSLRTAKETQDLGKNVVNAVNGLLGADLVGSGNGKSGFLGDEEFYN